MLKNNIVFGILVTLLIAGIAGTSFFIFSQNKTLSSPENNSVNESASTVDTGGLVNLREVGCQGKKLVVLSATGGKSSVDEQGNYQATFSSTGAQLVILTTEDSKELCAKAVSLPKEKNQVKFDAKSTAEASVFLTPGILSTDPEEAATRLALIDTSASFPKLLSLTQKQLPTLGPAKMNLDAEYSKVLTVTIEEVLQSIQKSFAALIAIDNSGSTNALAYEILISDDGSGKLIVRGKSPTTFPANTVDAKKIKDLIQQVGDIRTLKGGSCVKSTSFGTYTYLAYGGKQSGDISCTTGTSWSQAGYDLSSLVAQIQTKLLSGVSVLKTPQ